MHSDNSLTLLEVAGIDIDGRMEATVGDGVLAVHFVGSMADKSSEMVFDGFFAKDAPPDTPATDCSVLDMIGTWTPTTNSDLFEVVAGGNVTVREGGVRRTFDIYHQDNCAFWGTEDFGEYGSLALLGLVHSDLETAPPPRGIRRFGSSAAADRLLLPRRDRDCGSVDTTRHRRAHGPARRLSSQKSGYSSASASQRPSTCGSSRTAT